MTDLSYNRLLEVTKSITSTLSLSDTLQLVVNAIAQEIADVDLVGYFERNPEGTFTGKYANKVPSAPNPETGELMEAPVTMLVLDPSQDRFVKEIVDGMASVYVEDAYNDPRPNPFNVRLFDMKSCFGMPVHYEGELFGLVFVHDQGKAMNLPPDKREIVESFVAMAGVAINNARLFEDQQHLLSITQELAASLNVQQILDACFKSMMSITNATTCGIHLLKDSERGMVLQPAFLMHNEALSYDEWIATHQRTGTVVVADDALFTEAIRSHRAIAINDVFADLRPDHGKCRAFDIRSLMIVPMVAGGECIGAIAMPSIGKSTFFPPRIVRLCQSVADSTAIALRNAMTAQHLDELVSERTIQLTEAITKLESLDQMKTDFVSMVSHELRTPINIITQISDLFLEDMLGELDETQRNYMDKVKQHVGRLRDQVEDLLDFSKINSASFAIHQEPLDYEQLVKSVVSSMESSACEKNIAITLGVPPLQAYADKKRVEQILINLLSNALKFTPKDGTISIISQVKGPFILTEVRDTGIGINEKAQPMIFEKFFQVDSSTTRRYSGTGLGLTITKGLVEKHGGSIWVTSQEGVGSTFSFTLPLDINQPIR